MHTFALCQIFQVAADDGSEAFAAAVAEYGAPAVKAMEVKVGVHLSQVSLLGDDDVGAYHAPVSALSAKSAMTGDAPQQVVPHMGGASVGGVPAAGYHYSVPTEEFPGGVELVPPAAVPPLDC
ncbi:hypothetical protein CYMTET_23470 [Cymbomonas tetramitiformis]|uniref:Uncharacterized protein n=1 Tax=Cymbomonas tetramitiformis TaxID=36881 RepID=A0AAE0FY92_9CHLO|nr:hypothetical protein CYMTET_23470 [Cymbomonas tetramitiformis]